MILRLPENLRDALKAPLGILLKDPTKESVTKYLKDGTVLITVGDATTERILSYGITPLLQIVDGLEKRSRRTPPATASTTVRCDNPPAEITQQSIDAIRGALGSGRPTQLLVNGEEDLLVLPACIYAPENSVVMYGQPNEGLVIVQITQEIRNKTKNLLDMMN